MDMTELLTLARTWNETIKTVEDSGIFDDLDASEIQALDNLRTAIATGMVMSFFKKIEEVFQNHHRHILSFSSLNLDDAYVAKAEDLIESLEDHIAKLKKAIADRQFNQATTIHSVDVEVVDDDDDFWSSLPNPSRDYGA